ncbi:hypothetical protein QGN29_14150 [Temperatibacter marinus]|uniref:MoaD/ThiS family protein n=1 Tax=Temperatibacter marinus TaxID=1456591 RepID=A0AA52H913_9PROT|nr:hypothetical protein [Temperatibacter marinus]WND02691.1 hypothetical protein QGN29_14150 [Temperatibacter marinus]
MITLQLFGAFRDFNESNKLSLEYSEGMTVNEVKNQIRQHFQGQESFLLLLDRSRLADDTHIFLDGEKLNSPGDYALLPPVNGG